MNEAELLTQIQGIFKRPGKSNLIVPNGDDGAVFSASRKVIACADVAVEGVHFDLGWSSYFEVGRKITAANLADICAMGGWPEFLLVTVTLNDRHLSGALDLAEGIAQEADLVGAEVIGGDISSGDQLAISITALGETDKPILRSGAKVGDRVFVSHLPGLSATGLEILRRKLEVDSDLKERAVAQHKSPAIDYFRYREAYPLLNSAIDVSDGLIIDAAHIASSSGVRIEIDSNSLKKSELSEVDSDHYLSWVMAGGEDHVLLGTSSQTVPGFIEVGKVFEGSGVTLDGRELKRDELRAGGWSHSWGR